MYDVGRTLTGRGKRERTHQKGGNDMKWYYKFGADIVVRGGAMIHAEKPTEHRIREDASASLWHECEAVLLCGLHV